MKTTKKIIKSLMFVIESKIPDFGLSSSDKLSSAFRDLGISTFLDACKYVAELPYERNADKADLLCVLKEQRGTCSTKHAVLIRLAEANDFRDFRLVIGIFRMNAFNTPKVAGTLKKYNLEYIPEAHNYLKYKGFIIDYTGAGFSPGKYEADLLAEKEIRPEQITDFKVAYQKEFLSSWLLEQKHIGYSLEEIWTIREQCIRDLFT